MSGPLIFDRVKDTSTTTGTGTLTLANSAPSGYQTFGSVLATADTCYYCIAHQSAAEWEVGIGTYTASGTTLARTTVLASSNGGSAVSLSAGTKDVFLTYPAGRAVHGVGGTPWTPAALTWVADVDPDAVAGSDGDALASVASGGTAAAFTQSTGADKPLLKKAGNGINGHNVIRFDGSNDYLAAATGGAALASAWYMAAVVKWSSVSGYQHVICWGDDANHARRGMLKWGSGGGFTTNAVGFNSESISGSPTDIDGGSGAVVTTATVYFLEIWRESGGTVSIAVNGTVVATGSPSLSSYTGTAIVLGSNVTFGEPVAADLGRVWLLDRVLTTAEQARLRAYVATRFGLSVAGAGTAAPLVGFAGTAPGLVQEATAYQDASGNVIVGGLAALASANTQLDTSYTAALTVYGPFVAYAAVGEHLVKNTAAGQNTLEIWNTSPTGFSAERFRRTDDTGAEMGAMGYGRDLEPWGAATQGSVYIETSDFSGGDGVTAFRIIQTKGTGAGGGDYISNRFEVKANGDIVFRDQTHYTGQVDYFTVTAAGSLVCGHAALGTTATDGFLYIPTCNGAPTGTPTSYTGRVPVVYDTSTDKIYVYNSGWKKTAALT